MEGLLGDTTGVGVYVHIPFCSRICPYCDFAVVAARTLPEPVEARYVEALLAELDRRAPDFAGRSLATLYFGGGTPALFSPQSLARLHAAVRERFPGEAEVEVTLEANPSTLECDRLPAFRGEAGINRLSLGIQSFDDSLLKALGRAHRAEAGHRALACARRAGFDNVSLDLIFAALHQTPSMLEADLEAALAFGPEHVSAYELSIEPETPFGRAAARGRLAPYALDAGAALLVRLRDRLREAGYEQYELTSYARPGYASRHNRRYWSRAPVLGLGVGAHSCDPPRPGREHGARPANPRDLAAWQARALAGCETAEVVEVPSVEQARCEAMFLGLRRVAGLCAADFAREFGAPPRAFHAEAIELLGRRGLLLEDAAGDLRLSDEGQLHADGVFAYFA